MNELTEYMVTFYQ